MKNIALTLLLLFTFSVVSYAIYQPLNLGTVLINISSGTATDINASTGTAVGQARWCWNCGAAGNQGTICFSTGTVNWGSWVISTGTHCQ